MQGNVQKYNHKDIAWRIENGAAVTEQEMANLIAHNEVTRLVWMLRNNPASINDTLRHQHGFEQLPFAPDEKLLASYLHLLHQKGEEQILQAVINNFRYNPAANNWTSDPVLVEYLKQERVL